VLAVFFVPVFYVMVQGLIELLYGPPKAHPPAAHADGHAVPFAEPVPPPAA
jgi:HAE1 family hydrophobic/amphiphilic exporter-1